MPRWWQRLTGRPARGGGGRVTPERLQAMFDYTRRIGFENIGICRSSVLRELCFILGIYPEPRAIDMRRVAEVYRRDETFHLPPRVTFSWMPRFAHVPLVGGAVHYHWNADGHAPLWACPATRDPDRMSHIDAIFDHWEARLRQREADDAAAEARRAAADTIDRSNPMALIRRYLEQGDPFYLHEILGAPDTDDIILWVDWREEDDRIVSECARILGLNGLTARFVEREDTFPLELIRDGRVTMVDYDDPTNRNTTLIALDQVLRPDYELRYCSDSAGSDTAALLPLPAAAWRILERDYPDAVQHCFVPLSADTSIFT